MTNHNLSYIEKSISQEGVADELFALGYRTTPVIVIKSSVPVARGLVKGEQVIVGYNPNKLAQALL